MDNLLKINNLSVSFNIENKVLSAVKNISLDVAKGEALGIVGESGSGKSVTALSVLKLLPYPKAFHPTGEIFYKNKNILKLNEEELQKIRGNNISMIFQEPMTSLNPVFKINMQMNEVLIEHEGLTWDEANQRSIDMLNSVGIPNPEKRMFDYPHQFSGGMRQRAMIAMALLCNPALLIADEPTTALDVTIQAQILDLMMSLKEKRDDAAILLITHDLAVIAETCDRVIVMYGGKIQEIAEINELFANPVNPYTLALMESIPKLEMKERRLKSLKGMVPSILEMGDGCKLCSRFEPENCACKGTKEEPDLLKVSENHWARVHPGLLA